MHIIFNFDHEVSGTKVSCWNASYLLVEYFGKQDLKEVMFKILLLSVFSRPSTDLGTGDSGGKKYKSLLRALTYGLDNCCLIQIASMYSIHLNKPRRRPLLRNKSKHLKNIQN